MRRFGYTPPANCGQRYAHLVQAGGYGPDNPTGGKPWASSADVELWRGTAKAIFAMVRARWNNLIELENVAKVWTASTAIRDYVTAYESAYAALPEPKWYQAAGQDGALELVVRNAQAGACAIELLDDAIASAGGQAQPVPWGPPPPAPTDWAAAGSSVALLVAVVAGLWFFSQQETRRR